MAQAYIPPGRSRAAAPELIQGSRETTRGFWQESDLFQFAELPLAAYWVERACGGHLQGETSGRRGGTEKRQRGMSS